MSSYGPEPITAEWQTHGGEIRGTLTLNRVGAFWWTLRLLIVPPALLFGFLLSLVDEGFGEAIMGLVAWTWRPLPHPVPVRLTSHQLRIGRTRIALRHVRRVVVTESTLDVHLRFHRKRFLFHESQDTLDVEWLAERLLAHRDAGAPGTADEVPSALGAMREPER